MQIGRKLSDKCRNSGSKFHTLTTLKEKECLHKLYSAILNEFIALNKTFLLILNINLVITNYSFYFLQTFSHEYNPSLLDHAI